MSRCILAVETSCDETAAAVLKDGEIVAEEIHTQTDLHSYYGGVVPELASRDHVAHVGAVCQSVLRGHEDDLDLIAATRGPGLIGGLLVGLQWAKAYAFGRGLPFVGVHHLAGHLAAPRLDPEFDLEPPMVCLLISGGHTQLYAIEGWGAARLLGATRDDAAGEVFDKGARLLGLGYPGGPAVQNAASAHQGPNHRLPRPMLKRGLEMSFSGLKTALRDEVFRRNAEGQLTDLEGHELAFSLQEAIVDVLVHKACEALRETGYQRLTIGGGVAANGPLRAALLEASKLHNFELYLPPKKWCTDNAAMIAAAAAIRYEQKGADGFELPARARWPLVEEWDTAQTRAAR